MLFAACILAIFKDATNLLPDLLPVYPFPFRIFDSPGRRKQEEKAERYHRRETVVKERDGYSGLEHNSPTHKHLSTLGQ
jgi:hypothetical protein